MWKWLRRLRYIIRQRCAHADLSEELAFHRAMAERDLLESGAEPAEATLTARRTVGNFALAHDQVHDVWVPFWLQGIGHDFRLAIRTLVATPIVSAVAALSLALGIGGNTAIFSLIDGLLLRALPVKEPGRLVLLTDVTSGVDAHWGYDVWREIAARSRCFEGALAWSEARLNLAKSGEARFADGLWVTGSFFDVLGVKPALGRLLSRADDAPGGGQGGPVAVISYAFWREHFGGDRMVIGAPLVIERVPFTIVGITPRDFFGIDIGHSFDIAAPIQDRDFLNPAAAATHPGNGPQVQILGRLRPGETIESATTALRGIQPQIREATLPNGWPKAFLDRYLKEAFSLTPAGTGASALRRRFSRPLLVIMGVVALVLLIACANLANLALARAASRRRELGIRLAIGASRWRLLRQLMAESAVLAIAGAGLGLLCAAGSARLLIQQLSTTVSSSGPSATTGAVFVSVSIDGRVLAFTMALTVLTVLILGAWPAMRASRLAPRDALIDNRQAPHGRSTGPSDALIAAQVAISLIVIVIAGLFVRTLTALETRHLGFNAHGILIATIDAQKAPIPPGRRQALYMEVLDTVRHVPGVADAAFSSIPQVLDGPKLGQPIRAISGEAPLPPRGAFSELNLISPGWFQTMAMPLVAGRDVTPDDRLETPLVAVVNQAFVRTLLHGQNPLGRRVSLFLPGPPTPPVEIVGVVADAVYGAVRSPIRPTIFLPAAQRDRMWWPFLSSINLAIRSTASRPETLAKDVAAAIGRVNADLTLTFHPLTDYVNESLVQERLIARLSESFGLLAVLLAAIGLYGVTAYAVARRRSEIGIRIALGAGPTRIIRMVLGRIWLSTGVGILIGAAVSLWASSFVASLLYDVQPRDPATFMSAAALLAVVAFAAGSLPAFHATRTDPAAVIRCD